MPQKSSPDTLHRHIETQCSRMQVEMEQRFKDAFGIDFSAPFPEVEALFKERFGIEVSGHLSVFHGVLNRDVEQFLDENGNVLTDLTGTTYELCDDAVEIFLDKCGARIYEREILSALALAWQGFSLVKSTLTEEQTFEALHFLLETKSALGQAISLLDVRDRRKEQSRKAGLSKGANQAQKLEEAMRIYREHISPKLSNVQAAEILRNSHKITISLGGLARAISAEKRRIEGESAS